VADGEKIAIAGSGITGLMAAKDLADAGASVTIFEAGNRAGGKIQSSAVDGTVVNVGAEFIDKKNTRMIALCEQLGVELIPATDQATEQFHNADGKILSGEAFHAAYKPIAEQIIADKQNLIVDNKYTTRALQLNQMSLTDYLQELASKANPPVDPQIIETAARVYDSEGGRDPKNISAFQFVNEASGELGSFLNSDCGYRVKGGTEQIIHALKNYLQGKGVEFEMGAKATKVSKENGKFKLDFEVMPEKGNQEFDKVLFALPAPALGKIEGLEVLGLKPEERELLNNTQYTHSSKFFVKLKPDAQVDNTCFFSHDGFQSWISEKGMMTFLAGGETINERKGIDLVHHCLEEYSKAHGKKIDDIFETAPEKILFGAPDTKKPCYASPSAGQSIGLGGLFGAMDRLAKNGLSFAGTFLPRRDEEGASIGFMECGANSAARAANLLRAPTIEQTMDRPAANDGLWIQKIFANSKSAVGASYSVG